MILVASQRGRAKQLGLHLLKTEDNEHVELHEIRGFVSDTVVGALKEAQAISQGTRCKQFLFSVSLNPPEHERVPVSVFEAAIQEIEERNALSGQPRVVVFHEKNGRRHAHCVWSRIDADTMTAVNLPFFKRKLQDIAREIYLEQDWRMPRGLVRGQPADPRNFTLAEWQQAKRMGQEARDLKAMMQDCWAISDSRGAFEQALSERGMILAKGDRRGHVAVTHDGEVLSISRYAGKTSKEVRAKLGDPAALPSIQEAKAALARDMRTAFKRHAQDVQKEKDSDLEDWERRRAEMILRHRQDRSQLDRLQQQREADASRMRSARLCTGLRGLWQRITGNHAKIQRQNAQETQVARERDQAERQQMIERQLQERRALQWDLRQLRTRHARSLQSLRQDRTQITARLSAEENRTKRQRMRQAYPEPEP
ncbi:MAG: relaxase/mobilization nuclease domain-containing protein [Pseudomonadota bacterium]